MRAVVVADARLDGHDSVLSDSSARAAEGHEGGPGAVRTAAASIRTRSTEQRSVGASAVTALMLETRRCCQAVTALTHTRLLEPRVRIINATYSQMSSSMLCILGVL